MEFSIKFDTVLSQDGPLYILSLYCSSLKIDFCLANNADPDEMPHSSGSSLFAKVPV